MAPSPVALASEAEARDENEVKAAGGQGRLAFLARGRLLDVPASQRQRLVLLPGMQSYHVHIVRLGFVSVKGVRRGWEVFGSIIISYLFKGHYLIGCEVFWSIINSSISVWGVGIGYEVFGVHK